MNAKEMFEKLGYRIYETGFDYKVVYIKYRNFNTPDNNDKALPKEITFWKDTKNIDFEYGRLGSYLYYGLLQAINKQIEELGWGDK